MAGRSRTLQFVLAADAKQVGRAFSQVERGASRMGKSTDRVHSRFSSSWGNVGKSAVRGALGVTAAYVSISKAHAAISATEDLGKATVGLHRNLGITIQEASRWAGVAHARGIDNKQLTMSFTTLSRQVEAANSGSKKQQDTFRKLGLSQADLKRGTHDFSGLVTQLADGFGRLHGGTTRQAAAQLLLGRGYQSILPLFAEGSKSLREQLHWADQYGVTLDKRTLKPIERLTKAQRELKIANLGLKTQFTKQVAPALLQVEGAALKVLRVMNDKRLTSEQKWAKIGKIVGPIANKIGDGVIAAIPKIADGVGAHAPRVASAFAHGFLQANVWGKLAIGAWLFTKFGGIGAFGKAGERGGRAFGRRFGAGIIVGIALFGPEIAKQLGHTLQSASIEAAKHKGILGDLARKQLGADPRKEVIVDHGDLNKRGQPRILSLPPRYQGGLAVGDFQGQALSTHGGVSRRTGSGPIGDEPGAHSAKTLRDYRKHATAAQLATDALTASQRRQTRGSTAFANSTDLMSLADLRASKSIKKLERDATTSLRHIGDRMGFDTFRGRRAVEDNFRSSVTSVQRAMRKGTITTDQGMTEIRRLMRIHSKGGATVVDANFDFAVKQIRQGMRSGTISTRSGMRGMRDLMADLSKKGSGAVARNMGTFTKEVARAMRAGKITTRDGLLYIASAFNKSAKAFGFGKNVILGLGSIDTAIASTLPKNARGGKIARGGGGAGKGSSAFAEGGGWIGSPGEAGGDNVPIVVGRGEAVLNRHQQKPVEAALRATFGVGLDDLFARIQRPHYMAKGGYPLARPGKIIGTPYSGTHNLGNWQSDNAIDIAVPVGTPTLAMADGRIIKVGGSPSFAGRFGGLSTTLQGKSNAWFYAHQSKRYVHTGQGVSGGQTIGLSGMANGVAHLHFGQQHGSPLGVHYGGQKGTAGGGGAAVPSVPNYHPLGRLVVTGPDGLPKFTAQGALDKDRGIANRKLKSLHDKAVARAQAAAAAAGPTGGGGGSGATGGGGGSGLGQFQGRRVSKWIIPALRYAQSKGWHGRITSGFRTPAQNAAAGGSKTSNHLGINWPRGAIDVGGFGARAEGAYLNSHLAGYHGGPKLVWGGPVIGDWGHFSATGHARGGRVGKLLRRAIGGVVGKFARGGFGGSYSATSYGPPWGGIQGTGTTATGINLHGSPHRHIVAVDPSVIPLHSKLRISPNPFGYGGPFFAEDTGGAIKGHRIDFYDWRGRGKQLGWGRRSVHVSAWKGGAGGGGGGGGGKKPPKQTKAQRRAARQRREIKREDARITHIRTAALGNIGALDRGISGADTAVEDLDTAYTHQERVNDATTEDLFTPEGQATRRGEVGKLIKIKKGERSTLEHKRALIRKEAGRYKKLIAKLRRELKRKMSKAARKRVRSALASALSRYRALQKQAKAVGVDIEDITLDIGELRHDVDTEIAEAQPTPVDYLDAATAQAALTPGTADDVAAAQALVTYGTTAYGEAVKTGDPRKITEAATNLKGWQDALQSLSGGTAENTSAINDLTAELKRQNDQRAAVQAVGEKTALDMLSGVLSGRIGARTNQRQAIRTFGSVMRA